MAKIGVFLLNKPTGASVSYSDYSLGSDFFATGTILDDDGWTIEVAATDGAETASGTTTNPVVFTLTRSGATDLAQATTVYYELTGAAISGSDYSVANGTFSSHYGYISIPANATPSSV